MQQSLKELAAMSVQNITGIFRGKEEKKKGSDKEPNRE